MANNIILLLVDDDPIVLSIHQILLKKIGITCNIFCSPNGEHALNFMNSCVEETIFFVLLDINMPVMNGWEFLDALQRHPRLPNTTVYMVSSADGSEMQRAASFAYVAATLSKPLTINDCQHILARLQRG
ncbi:response regulator [Dyadobacter sp. CY347]|uniref:response regulator n=1 Tax=Dyadobacter sp. CY347 TaxID=2909336 RepID=UPI001F1BFFA5|nr:response regulator [Dyadobacter sp. CY347]MCF2488118.1 response regulator [Dyadobacter sp. CY347]